MTRRRNVDWTEAEVDEKSESELDNQSTSRLQSIRQSSSNKQKQELEVLELLG